MKNGIGNGHHALSRRSFLRFAAGAATLSLAACVAPAAAPASGGETAAPAAAPGKVHYLQWTSFVEPADVFLMEDAAVWGPENNIEVQVERINNNDIPARIASAIQSQDGPDIIQQIDNWGHLFADNLLDVGDVVADLSAALGEPYADQVAFSQVDGVWRTVPYTIVGNSHIYRKDLFEKVLGRTEWGIDTWEDYVATATAMKEAGHPFGNSIGHSFGDPPSFWYPFLWCHGGTEVNEDGSAVTLNSAETVAALENAIAMAEAGFVDGVVAWDDGSNNRAYLASEVSSTLNGASIYFVAKRDLPDVHAVSGHGLHPSGPAGRFSWQGGRSNGILGYSANVDAAKAFMRHIADPEFYEKWLVTSEAYNIGSYPGYNDEAVWAADENLHPFRDAVKGGTSRWPGYPGAPNAAAFAVRNDYIIVDVFAKAVSGEMSAAEAAEWGAGEVAKRYGL